MNCRSLVVPALIAGLAVAGCGGSKGLSRSELVAKADPICKRANEALKTSKISPDNLATVAPRLATVDQGVASALQRLSPPSSMSADWSAIVDSWKTAGEGLSKLGEAAKAKQRTNLLVAEGVFTKAQSNRATIAARDGFKLCGSY